MVSNVVGYLNDFSHFLSAGNNLKLEILPKIYIYKEVKRFLKALALHFAPHHYHQEIRSCNVATPNRGRHLWWTRHPHVHLAAAAQPLFDPKESNPVDRKMRGRDALNLYTGAVANGSSSHKIIGL
ncbi:hypothetical protein TNCV_1456101 [Trichonephila clavipes]|nr:hypothetical protein TNCV_1456101 [Trichonephila clavipes]